MTTEARATCQSIEADYLVPGWICCACRTYNGNQRDVCKIVSCQHQRCDDEAGTGLVIRPDGTSYIRDKKGTVA